MFRYRLLSPLLLFVIFGCTLLFLSSMIFYLPSESETCLCGTNQKASLIVHSTKSVLSESQGSHNKRLAVIVPFRDRFDELLEFVPHMHIFLNNQSVEHEIFVVNQKDEYRFNRASLINIGYLHAARLKTFDYMVMHDVDLLPMDPQLQYSYPGDGYAYHVSSPKLHPNYHYETFVGGILILTLNDFKQINGLSNKYWGWGLEDDEFYLRMKQGNIKIKRPDDTVSFEGKTAFRHVHNSIVRVRDKQRCFDQKAASRKRDRVTGVHDVAYSIQSIVPLTIHHAPVTVLNVELKCNKSATPWCKC